MKLNLTAVFAAFATLFLISDRANAQQGMGVGNANPLEMLDVTGAIKIGTDINNTNAAPTGGAGTIRFRAGQFEGWDGTSWIPLGGGGGNSPFLVNTNLVQPNTSFVTYATDDFIFGSPSLDDDGDTDHDGRFFYDKNKGAFRAGLVTGDQWNNIKRGNQSFAAGFDVTASGDYAMTLGEKSWATAIGAIAMGRKAYAEGDRSFAWGNDVQATGEGSVALGRLAFSTADYSYAVGTNVNASAEYSMVVGADANATESYAIALGNNVNATAASAFVLGHNSTASAYEASAIGYDVNALGEQSIGFGHDLTALSNYEVAMGRFNSVYVPSSSNSWEPTDRLLSIGNGENSTSRSNALTILKNGNTGIGTSIPSATLHVDGSMRLVDGNQSNGFVLTSDGVGNATWQAANTGSDNQNLTGATLTGTNLQIDIEDGTSTTVDLSALVDDADADASNELQTLSVSGPDVTLSNGGGTVTVNDGDWTINGNNQYSAVSGNVGVGMLNPASKLHIEGTTTDETGGFRLTSPGGTGVMYLNSGNDIVLRKLNQTDQLVLDINGNVGVGTNAPADELHVEGSLRMVDGNQATGYIPVSDANGRMVWTDPTTITTAADGDGNSNNELQTLSQSGNDVTLSNGGGTISVADDDNDSSNEFQTLSISGNDITLSDGGGTVTVPVQTSISDVDSDTKIQVEEGADEDFIRFDTNGAERMVITNGGSIGVGTDTPQAMLDIQSGVPTPAGGIRLSNTAAGNGLIYMEDNDMVLRKPNRDYQLILDNTGRIGMGVGNPQAKLHIHNATAGSTSGLMLSRGTDEVRMYLTSNNDFRVEKIGNTNQLVLDAGGNVGIGTDAPTSKLHVDGAVRMVDGNEAVGYIPVSDANGTMVWTDPTTITTAADGDGNSSNELQTLSQSGTDVTLSNGGGTISVADNDNDATNELQDLSSTSSGTNRTINIFNGTGTTISVADNDNDSANELQTISQSGTDITLSNGGGTISVADNDNDATNELQTLSISGNDITLSNGGGTVSVPTQMELADSDNDTKIQVEESADEDIIRFDTDGTERMVIRNDGRVGIGQSNPAWPATVRSDENIFSATDVIDPAKFALTVVNGVGNNDEGVGLGLGSSNNGNQAGAGIVFKKTNNNSLGDLMLTVKSNGTTNGPQFPAMTIKPISGNIEFGRNTNGANIEREILIAGKLEGDVNPYVSINFQNYDSNSGAIDYVGASIRSHNNGSSDDGDLRFFTTTNQTLSEAMKIDHIGNVGVGESNPQEELHVDGSIRMVDGNQQAGYVPVSDANGTMVWTNPLGLSVSELSDADNDTKIQVEESADEDIIRFDVSGTEHFTMNGSRLGVHNSGRSVRIGENAGPADDLTNNDNTFVGYETGLTVTTGYNNTAVGTRAFFTGNGYDNAAFGNWTLYSATGVRNTALGSRAGQSIVGNENTIVGSFAGKDATGSGNVFLGHAAGQSESGDDKLYIENTSSNTPLIYGEFNNDIVAINGELGVGTQAPEALLHASSGSTGDANGLKLTQGTANSLIYHNSGNDLVIRKAAQTDQLVLDDGGNVGVGTSSPGSKLHVTTSGLNGFENFAARIENTSNFSGFSNGLRITAGQNFQTDNNRFISFRRPDGTEVGAVRQITSSSVDFWSPSDQRLKSNIMATTKGLADLMQLQVKDYVYKDDPEKPQTGFLAQQVYEVFPNAVSVGGDDAKTDPWMMNYGNLTPLLVKAVQDLSKKNDDLQMQIEELKMQIQGLNRN